MTSLIGHDNIAVRGSGIAPAARRTSAIALVKDVNANIDASDAGQP